MPTSTVTADKRDGASVLEWVLGLTATPSRGSFHDFDLRDRGGTVAGTLDVAPLRPPPAYPHTCTAPNLRRSWVLGVVPGGHLLGRHGEARRLLAGLERADVWQFGPDGLTEDEAGGDQPSGLSDGFAELGIVSGTSLESAAYPPIVQVVSASGPATCASGLNELVERAVWDRERRPDPGVAHHLLLWVGGTDLEARAAMERDGPPEPPLLPEQVGSVWLARCGRPEGLFLADRVWQTNDLGEWEALGPVPRVAPHAGRSDPGGRRRSEAPPPPVAALSRPSSPRP